MIRDSRGVPRRTVLRAAAGIVPAIALGQSPYAAHAAVMPAQFLPGQPLISPEKEALKLRWTAVANAESYRVESGRNRAVSVGKSVVSGISGETAIINDLGARELDSWSGNYTFTRVVAVTAKDSRGDRRQRSSGVVISRPTPVQPNPAGTKVTVGTYNVLSCASGTGVRSWKKRRTRVAAVIKNHMPDVLAVQEATPLNISTSITGFFRKRKKGKRVARKRRAQYLDLQRLLASRGYALDTRGKITTGGHRSVVHGGRILYNSKAMRLISRKTVWLSGYHRPSGDRYASVATFKSRKTGVSFVFASVHLTPKNTVSLDILRRRQIEQLIAAIKKYNVHHLPVVVAGDLNSTQLRQTSRAHVALRAAGYFDARGAVTQIGTMYPSYTNFRTRPAGSDSRFDYIMVKGAPGAWTYRNVFSLNADGKYRLPHPSDHNLQLATLSL